ncbi:MAG TPA: VOC family protein [Flavitalea sp.]|nr:VOC family protein [Flavitalea sp.]HTF29991.1 VOC family protein [Flavitalea sp.]
MSQAIVYLNFDGNASEAMNFYKNALGGELELQKVKESAMTSNLPETVQDQILHGCLTNEGIIIMASDMCGMGSMENGNSVQICLNCDSDEEINTFFNNLSTKATIKEPLSLAPWGATFGMLTDQFGKHWMFNYTQPQ